MMMMMMMAITILTTVYDIPYGHPYSSIRKHIAPVQMIGTRRIKRDMSMGGLMAEVTMESESRFAINTLTRYKK